MDLVCVYQSTDRFQFQQVKMLLEDANISFRERNSMDSMYNNFGTFEVYVNKEVEEKAIQLISETFG
jgi:hypothetical protein